MNAFNLYPHRSILIWRLATSLNLGYNQIGLAGAEALATLGESLSLAHLTLRLHYNPVGESGRSALAAIRSGAMLKSTQVHY